MRRSTHIEIVHALSLIIILIIHTFANAAPIDGISADDEEAYKRSMFIQRLMSVKDRLDLDKELNAWPAYSDISPYIKQQKRYKPPLQGRSGGMSLCLWKVCPAAPWLVSKKRNI